MCTLFKFHSYFFFSFIYKPSTVMVDDVKVKTPPKAHDDQSRLKSRRQSQPSLVPASSSVSSTDSIANLKKQNYKQHLTDETSQCHLRSYGRQDVVREKLGFLGWTLSRWLLLLANTVVIIMKDYGFSKDLCNCLF